jgi:hypothetical protein
MFANSPFTKRARRVSSSHLESFAVMLPPGRLGEML